VESGITSKKNKYILSTASCEVYTCSIRRFSPPERESTFVKAVKMLPEVYSSTGASHDLFIDFLRTYGTASFSIVLTYCHQSVGTHVVTEAVMGSRLTIKSEFSATSWKKLQASTLDVAVAASYSYDSLFVSGSAEAKAEVQKMFGVTVGVSFLVCFPHSSENTNDVQ